MTFKTADLCDEHILELQVAQPIFKDYGGKNTFHGAVATLKVFEDNSLVRSTLESAGDGRILVVDGGGSTRCALLGGNLAVLADQNGWAGLIINGCVRDSREIGRCNIGVKALATHPRKSEKKGRGDANLKIRFADVTFSPGSYAYADEDGIVVSETPLAEPSAQSM